MLRKLHSLLENELIDYLQNPLARVSFRFKQKALNYALKFLDKDESYKGRADVHEGICGSHRGGPIM